MSAAAAIREEMASEWLPTLYQEKVRSQRTRSYALEIAKRESNPEIQYTLMGIELKVGRKRFACPDLATARYLRVFARIGCAQFAVPYDISRLPAMADELETSWQRSLVLLQKMRADGERSKLIKLMRDEINATGPGDAMPLFDRETRRRN